MSGQGKHGRKGRERHGGLVFRASACGEGQWPSVYALKSWRPWEHALLVVFQWSLCAHLLVLARRSTSTPHLLIHVPQSVCLLLQDLLQSCSRGGPTLARNPVVAACTGSVSGLLSVNMHALVSPLYYTPGAPGRTFLLVRTCWNSLRKPFSRGVCVCLLQGNLNIRKYIFNT
jgi:hypothetical protein